MHPIRITHYVKDSYQNKPSFIILMSDNVEYISNGCVFSANTEENRNALIERFYCTAELTELLDAPSIDNDQLTNGHRMYHGCTSLTEAGDYPRLTHGWCMYRDCNKLVKAGNYPALTHGWYMYGGCTSLVEAGNYPVLTNDSYMYKGCTFYKN